MENFEVEEPATAQDEDPPVSATQPTRPGRAAKLAGVVLLVIGMVLGGLGVSLAVPKVSGAIVDSLSAPVFTTPGDAQVRIKRAGNYLIMQGTSYRSSSVTSASGAAVTPGDAALLGPDGRELTLTPTSGNSRVTRDSAEFFDILKFHAPSAGYYRLSVFEPSGVPLIVVPALSDSFRRAAPWIGVALAGGLFGLAGVVLLIVGFTRAARVKNQPPPAPAWLAAGYGTSGAAAPGARAPGWYPDPSRPGPMQWWDGTRWRP